MKLDHRIRAVHLLLFASLLLLAPDALAGGTDLLEVTAAFDRIIGFFTGPFARLVGILALVAAGFAWFKTREEGGEKLRLLGFVTTGIALMVGAANIFGALGFTGATF